MILIDDLRGMCHCDGRTNLPLRLIIEKLKNTHPGLKFYSLGDIGIVFNEAHFPAISVSEIAKASSISRFFDPACDDDAALEELIRAEALIASVKEGTTESDNFCKLTQWVDRNSLGEEVIYLLWGALQKLEQKEYASAINDLSLIGQSFYFHWRIDAYLVKALILDGQWAKARFIFNEKLAMLSETHPKVLALILGGDDRLNALQIME